MEVKREILQDSHTGRGDCDEKAAFKIPFEYVSFQIREQLAMLMDPPNMKDWRALAEKLDFTANRIRWIPNRKMDANLGSDTLTMFQDFCSFSKDSSDSTVGMVMKALEAICRLDALNVLKKHLKEIEDAYEKNCQRMESNKHAVPNSEPNSRANSIKDRRCSEPMDVAESFMSPIDGDVGANVTLDHDYDGANSGSTRNIRLCQKCITFTGPCSRSYNSIESGRCSHCSRQLTDQNHNRTSGPLSWSHGCSVPNRHERTCSYTHHPRCHTANGPERSLTYPRCKAEQHTHRRSSNNTLTPWISADATMLTGPFHQATTYAHVFVSYAHDTKKHMRMVLSLCRCLKENHFPCSLDEAAEHFDTGEKHLWVNDKFTSADFILVCISQQYLDDIRQPSPSRPSLSTAHIYRLMEMECRHGRCQRIIPLLFPGVSYSRLPDWMQRVPTIYRWPEEYKNLFFLLMKPETLVNQFVRSRQANGSMKNPVVYKTVSLP